MCYCLVVFKQSIVHVHLHHMTGCTCSSCDQCVWPYYMYVQCMSRYGDKYVMSGWVDGRAEEGGGQG